MKNLLSNLAESGPMLRDAVQRGNLRVLTSMLGPAWRGFVRQRGKGEEATPMALGHDAHFDWRYARTEPEIQRLYEAAKNSQWNSTTELDWSTSVDPRSTAIPLMPDSMLAVCRHPAFLAMTEDERGEQRQSFMGWLLSQFLHGEQGALYAAAQVTQSVPWMDAKLFGSTQVIDEGRHVEVFHTYLSSKLGRVYDINDNLYVVIDALMTDSRWDLKFLGMQIMIEGLALGAFGFLRSCTSEPLLKKLLTYVIADEARHVHYGVLSLKKLYAGELSEKERREREDWAFEVSVLLRSRFLGHEFYEEYWAHVMTVAQWDKLVEQSEMMRSFQRTMFKRIIPNLKRIGLLSDRVRARYDALGLLAYENDRAAPDLTAQDLLNDI
jgi:hypothetical protein